MSARSVVLAMLLLFSSVASATEYRIGTLQGWTVTTDNNSCGQVGALLHPFVVAMMGPAYRYSGCTMDPITMPSGSLMFTDPATMATLNVDIMNFEERPTGLKVLNAQDILFCVGLVLCFGLGWLAGKGAA